MKNKPTKAKYREGMVLTLIERIAHFYKQDPKYLLAVVTKHYPEILDKAHCPNCGESMMQYDHKLDFFNALLLKEMGDVVKKRLKKGMSLKDANAVHVVTENLHDCVRHRTTQCRTLGLIAKVKKSEDGKTTHDTKKGWLITARGFAALRGERVPAEVRVFRNQIEERPDLTATLDEVFEAYKGENKHLVGDHNPKEWVNFAELHNGQLF